MADTRSDGPDVIDAIRRNWAKIIFSLLAAWTLGAAYLLLVKPSYTATTQLFIDPRTRKVVSEDIVQGGGGIDLALFESQISIIGSDSVLQRVIEKEKLTLDPEFSPEFRVGLVERLRTKAAARPAAPDATTMSLIALAQAVRVRRAQNTYVINVDVKSNNPVKSSRVANAIAQAYLDDQADAKSDAAKRANSLIDARLDELKEQVRRAEVRVDEFKRANRIVTSEGGLLNEQQLTKLNTELVTTRGLVAISKARLDELNAILKRGVSPESLPDAMSSGVIQRLRDQYATVTRREAALNSQLQPRHPALADARSQVAAIKTQIAAELKRIEVATQTEYQIAANREREIASTLGRSEDEVSKTTTAQIKLREYERESEASREVLRAFLARAKETQEQGNTSVADARIIGPAAVPTKPSSPNSLIVAVISTLAGLGLGLGQALLQDYQGRPRNTSQGRNALASSRPSDDTPSEPAAAYTATALPQFTRVEPARSSRPFARLPLLARPGETGRPLRRFRPGSDPGGVPTFGDFIACMTSGGDAGGARFREATQSLLDKVRNRRRTPGPQIVLLVGHDIGVGTSSTALSLAYAAAASGDRTLLVDAASIDASLSTVFAGDLEQSEPCVLDDKDDLAAISARDSRSGLTLLPIALADLRQLRVSQRQRFAIGLKNLAADFDFVVIDGGRPTADDAIATLAPLADPILIVTTNEDDAAARTAEIVQALEIPADRVAGSVVVETSRASRPNAPRETTRLSGAA